VVRLQEKESIFGTPTAGLTWQPAILFFRICRPIERVLAAVGQCLDRQSAESLLRLRADTEMQGRIEELADKCTEGRLTPEEREEYEAMIRVGNFVAILQAKARRLLAEGHAA
jgi:CBS domain containing-hemolysin-like protein